MDRYAQSRLFLLFFVIFLVYRQFSAYSHIQNLTSVLCNNYGQSEKLNTEPLQSTKSETSRETPRKLNEAIKTAKKVLIVSQFRSGKV